MKVKILSALFFVLIGGLCVAYERPQGQDPQSLPIPAPAKDEVIVVFDNGTSLRAKIGCQISIPANEKLRGVWGSEARVVFSEKGAESGNAIWLVKER